MITMEMFQIALTKIKEEAWKERKEEQETDQIKHQRERAEDQAKLIMEVAADCATEEVCWQKERDNWIQREEARKVQFRQEEEKCKARYKQECKEDATQ